MRTTILALAAVAALSVTLGACNPSAPADENAAQQNADAFPDLANASYRAEATITDDAGRTSPIVMIREGRKLRMEFATPEGQTTMISNAADGETFILTNVGGRTMALRAEIEQLNDPTAAWQGELARTATRTGACSVAGENGDEWTRTDEGGATKTACVTRDGILLRAVDGERTVWETTQVARGPQPADQFQLPEGVQVMDLGNMGGLMNEALKQAQDGR